MEIIPELGFRKLLLILAFLLFSIITIGLFVLATSPVNTVSLTLAFVAGLSMIFLPCTLPLVFVIVPMSMGETPKKGFFMALLFGLGLTITIGIYGITVAVIGQYLGMDVTTRTMFLVAGLIAFTFGLSELKLIKLRVPGFHGGVPGFIQNRKDYAKSFLMGLLLGNAGIGCPNPAFYTLLIYIASVGSIFTGGALGLIHGIGRAVPLLFLSIAAILGLNATGWVVKKRFAIEKLVGWALLAIGAFIFIYGLYGMHWWEDSVFHKSWNLFWLKINPNLAEDPGHPIREGAFEVPIWVAWMTLFVLVMTPAIIYRLRK